MLRIFLNILCLGGVLFISSCIIESDDYDATADWGTYTGEMTVYTGPGTDEDYVDRTCPDISASLSVADGVAVLTTTDTYPNYVHSDDVVTTHVGSGDVFENNKFEIITGWEIEETDTQLEDLMTLEFCDASAPTFPGDTSTGDRGRLQDFYMEVSEDYFVGEYGQGRARGTLIYGVRCTDGEKTPLCVYFMQLDKE